jgi:hypothetical protein
MGEIAQRKQEEEWRAQRAVVPFVRSAVEAQAAALAASSTPSSAASGSSSVSGTGRRSQRVGLKQLYDLLQACVAVPELAQELSAQQTAYPHQGDSLLRMEHLRARLAALRVHRNNLHVLPMQYAAAKPDTTATAASAATTTADSATHASDSTPPAPAPAPVPAPAPAQTPSPLPSPPRVVIVLTDLSLDDMRLIKSCLLRLAVARGLANADAPPVSHSADPFTLPSGGGGIAPSSSSSSSSRSLHGRGLGGLDASDEDDAWMVVQLGDVQLHAFTGAEQFSALEAVHRQYGVDVSAGTPIQHADFVRAASAAHAASNSAAAGTTAPPSSDEPHAQRLPSVHITRFQVLLKASSTRDEHHVAIEAPPMYS